MIEETATVLKITGRKILLETQRQSACQTCSVKSGCGTSTLAKVVGNRSSQFTLDNWLDARVGETVVVAVDENALVQGSLLLYLFPLIFIIIVGLLAEFLFATELITIFFVVTGFAFAMLFVRFFSKSYLKKSIQPHLIRRV